jgi:hypothetical protein
MTKYPIRNSVHMLSFRISIKLNKSVDAETLYQPNNNNNIRAHHVIGRVSVTGFVKAAQYSQTSVSLHKDCIKQRKSLIIC